MPESGSTYCFSISAFLRTISQSMMTVSIVRTRLMRHHTILLECENEDEFQELEEEFAATHQPATPAEQDLVNEMVAARWRINRIRTIEWPSAPWPRNPDRSLCVTAMNPVSRACTSAPTAPSASCNRKPNPRNKNPTQSHPSRLNQTGASR